MTDRLERFVVRIMQPLDGLAFLFVIVNAMIGIAILGDWLGSHALPYVGLGVGLLVYVSCAAIEWRSKHRHQPHSRGAQLEPTCQPSPSSRLPLKFIGYAAVCIAGYGWGMLAGTRYPTLHPIGGELRALYVILIALAGGYILVGVVGFADPRICFAIHRSTRGLPLPFWARMAGWALMLSGCTGGGYLAYLVTAIAA
jgi:hypothetical protein